MKRVVLLALTALVLMPGLALAGGIGEDAAAETARAAFLSGCRYAEGDLADFTVSPPRLMDLSGKKSGKGRAACWVVNISYTLTHPVGSAARCELVSIPYTVIMAAEDGKVLQKTDGAEFAGAVGAYRKLGSALSALEREESEKGDYLTWPEGDRKAFLEEYGAYNEIDRYAYPGPEGMQVWEAYEIAIHGIREKYGTSPGQLEELRMEASYGRDVSDAIDRCTFMFMDGDRLAYSVDIDVKTGEITNLMN